MRHPLACNTLGNLAPGTGPEATGKRAGSTRRAVDHVDKKLDKEHPLYGSLMSYTGYNYLEEGKLDEAEAALKQAMAIFDKRKLTATHPMVAD